jgi:chitinase
MKRLFLAGALALSVGCHDTPTEPPRPTPVPSPTVTATATVTPTGTPTPTATATPTPFGVLSFATHCSPPTFLCYRSDISNALLGVSWVLYRDGSVIDNGVGILATGQSFTVLSSGTGTFALVTMAGQTSYSVALTCSTPTPVPTATPTVTPTVTPTPTAQPTAAPCGPGPGGFPCPTPTPLPPGPGV